MAVNSLIMWDAEVLPLPKKLLKTVVAYHFSRFKSFKAKDEVMIQIG